MYSNLFNSMNANTTTPRQRSTRRSPRSTTGSGPALDRYGVPLCLDKTQSCRDNLAVYNLQEYLDVNAPYHTSVISELLHLNVLTGLRVRGRRIPQEEKEVAIQISLWALIQRRIWWVDSKLWWSIHHRMEEVLHYLTTCFAWNQREAIKNPRSTRRRARRDATSL